MNNTSTLMFAGHTDEDGEFWIKEQRISLVKINEEQVIENMVGFTSAKDNEIRYAHNPAQHEAEGMYEIIERATVITIQ